MEEKGNLCTDPMLLATEQKEWGLIFCCLVWVSLELFANENCLLVLKFASLSKGPGCPYFLLVQIHITKFMSCGTHDSPKSKHHLLLEKEFPYLWGKKSVSFSLFKWNFWSDAPANGCDSCKVFCWFFAEAGVGKVMEVMGMISFLHFT